MYTLSSLSHPRLFLPVPQARMEVVVEVSSACANAFVDTALRAGAKRLTQVTHTAGERALWQAKVG